MKIKQTAATFSRCFFSVWFLLVVVAFGASDFADTPDVAGNDPLFRIIGLSDSTDFAKPNFLKSNSLRYNIAWQASFRFPLYKDTTDMSRFSELIKDGLGPALQRQRLAKTTIASALKDVRQALYLDPNETDEKYENVKSGYGEDKAFWHDSCKDYERMLCVIFNAYPEQFKAKGWPLKGMELDIIVRRVPISKKSKTTVVRIVEIDLDGCPQVNAVSKEEANVCTNACTLSLGGTADWFNPSQLLCFFSDAETYMEMKFGGAPRNPNP